MKPQPVSHLYSDWKEIFAWLPVRSRSGDLLWLRRVYVRDVQVSLNTISISRFEKEYDTYEQIVLEKLSGKNRIYP